MIKTELIENIVESINMKGYDCFSNEVNKNGVIYQGIVFKQESGINPTLYLNNMTIDDTTEVEEIVMQILQRYEEFKMQEAKPDFSRLVSCFEKGQPLDEEYFLSHVILCARKKGIDDKVRVHAIRNTDLVSYVRIAECGTNGFSSIALTLEQIRTLESKGLSETKIFNAAKKNMRNKMVLKDVSEVLGLPTDFGTRLYVLRPENQMFGAGYFADSVSLRKVCKELNTEEIVILPSSIHELLVFIRKEGEDLEPYNDMIREINSSEVDPTEVLSDHYYTFSLTKK